MTKAVPNLDFTIDKGEDKDVKSFSSMLARVYRNLTLIINGNLGFGDGTNSDNINGVWLNTTAPAAPNTDFTLTHNLGRVPVGYWIMEKDRAVDVYTGSVAATTLHITLRATVASAVIRLFVICLLLGVLSLSAQTVNITLQVTDLGGQSWNNGTWTAKLVSPPGVPAYGPPFYLFGTITNVPNQLQTGQLNASGGSGTITLTYNSAIAPSLSQWLFTVSPQASPVQAFSQFVTITSLTSSVTLTPPAILINLSTTNSPIAAYSANELIGAVIGSQYTLLGTGLQTCTAVSGGICTTWLGASQTPPGAPANSIQKNCAGLFCASSLSESGGVLTIAEDSEFCGPSPYIDIRCYGGRFGDTAHPGNIVPTGTIVNGSNSLTVTANVGACSGPQNCWQVGDWIVVQSPGPANTMGTLSAPTLACGQAIAIPGIDYDVAAPAGTTQSPYYKYVVYDSGGGYTAASTEVSSSTCQPIGASQQTLTVTTAPTRSGTTMTWTPTTAPNAILSPGATVFIAVSGGTCGSDNSFCGNQNVQTVNGTTFTTLSPYNTNYGATSTGSAVTYVVTPVNTVRLSFPVYPATGRGIAVYESSSSGAETLYACNTIPSNSALNNQNGQSINGSGDQLMWEDLGSTSYANAKKSCPWFLPTNAPSSAGADNLSARISAIVSNTFTLVTATGAAANASNANCASGGCAVYYDAAASLAEADLVCGNAGGPGGTNPSGSLWIPPNFFSTYSFTTNQNITHCHVIQSGNISLYDTLHLDKVSWWGDIFKNYQDCSYPSFALECHTPINVYNANPGLLLTGNSNLRGVAVIGNNNADFPVFNIPTGEQTWRDVTFYASGIGTGLYSFANQTSAAFGLKIYDSTILGDGGGQTPAFINKNNNLYLTRVSMSQKGIFDGGFQQNGVLLEVWQDADTQGPTQPIFTIAQAPGAGNVSAMVKLHNVTNDSGNFFVSPLLYQAGSGVNGIFNGTFWLDNFNTENLQGAAFDSILITGISAGCPNQFPVVCMNQGNSVEVHNQQITMAGPSSNIIQTLLTSPNTTNGNVVPTLNEQTLDNFNRASLNTGGPCSGGSCWNQYLGNCTPTISSNTMLNCSGVGRTAFTGMPLPLCITSGRSCYAEATEVTVGTFGPAILYQDLNGNSAGWWCYESGSTLTLGTLGNGAQATASVTVSSGDVLQVVFTEPSTASCKQIAINGAVTAISSSFFDAPGSTPIYAGVSNGNLGSTGSLDNWQGGYFVNASQQNVEQAWPSPQHFLGNGGQCTMSSSTTCTVTIGTQLPSSYNCLVTAQGTGAIAAACALTQSGTTTIATITAASSNSQVWTVWVF